MAKLMAHYGTDDGKTPLCSYGSGGTKRELPCKKPSEMAGMAWCPECQEFLLKTYGHCLPDPPELEAKPLPEVGTKVTSENWVGEVRAVVDGDQLVILVGDSYVLRNRYYWDMGLLVVG
jgi:hypothetical protein